MLVGVLGARIDGIRFADAAVSGSLPTTVPSDPFGESKCWEIGISVSEK